MYIAGSSIWKVGCSIGSWLQITGYHDTRIIQGSYYYYTDKYKEGRLSTTTIQGSTRKLQGSYREGQVSTGKYKK